MNCKELLLVLLGLVFLTWSFLFSMKRDIFTAVNTEFPAVSYQMDNYKSDGQINTSQCLKLAQLQERSAEKKGVSCSWDVIRCLYEEEGYFPSKEGSWEFKPNGLTNFYLKACQFRNSFPKPSVLKECFDRNVGRKVIMTGDSNGGRYAAAFIKLLNVSFNNCFLRRKEIQEAKFMVDINFFINGTKFPKSMFTLAKRACHSCISSEYVCTNPTSNKNISIEFLAAPKMLDPSIKTNASEGYPATNSAQEFFIKMYYKYQNPDVLLVTCTFVHERDFPLVEAYKRLEELVDMITTHVPRDTKVIWIPAMSSYSMNGSERMTANEKSMLLNRRLFDMIKNKLIDPGSNWYGFYDLQFVSQLVKHRYIDGVHVSEFYYEVMMGHLLQLFCSEESD